MNDEKLIEKKDKSELIYDGRVLHLYRDEVILPNGNKDIREYCAHNGGVCVAPLTDKDELIFVKQFRYPYMEEIYDYIARESGVSDSLKNEIMNYEITVERQVIVVRKEMVEVFNYCKETGKKTYIVSDMYMHQKDLEDIINNLGIVGYDKIFVSSEYDTSKPQHLFEEYKKEIIAENYLHIGDSFACDMIFDNILYS